MLKKFLFIFISFVMLLNLFACKETVNNSYEDIRLVSEYSSSTSVDEMDSILFGSYRQGNNNDIEAIEWLALDYDKVNNRVLLLSKDIIDSRCYQDISEDEFDDMFYSDNPIKLTWENCSLRKWLNNEFYNTAFNDNEKQRILVMNIANNDNIDTGAKSGVNTYDKVFLLSIDEMRKYFGSGVKYEYGYELNKKAATRGTDFAKKPKFLKTGMKELYVSDDIKWYGGNSGYWLRTIGTPYGHATIVTSDGNMNTTGDLVCACYGVRPAIWVYTGEVENTTDAKEDNKEIFNDTYLMNESEEKEENQESEDEHNENQKGIDNEVIKDGKQKENENTPKDGEVIKAKISKTVKEPKMILEYQDESDLSGNIALIRENMKKGYILNDTEEERKRLRDYRNSISKYEEKMGLNYEVIDNTLNELGYLKLYYHPYDGKGDLKERLKVDFPEFKDDEEVLNFMAKVYEYDHFYDYLKNDLYKKGDPRFKIKERIFYDYDENTGVSSIMTMYDEDTGKMFYTRDLELYDKWYKKAVYNGVMDGGSEFDIPHYTLSHPDYKGSYAWGGYTSMFIEEKERRKDEEAKLFTVPLPANEVKYYNEAGMCTGSTLKYINALNSNGVSDYSLKGGVIACNHNTYVEMIGDWDAKNQKTIKGALLGNNATIYKIAEAEAFRLNNPGAKFIDLADPSLGIESTWMESYMVGMPRYTYKANTSDAISDAPTGWELAWYDRQPDFIACDSYGEIQYAISFPSQDLRKTRGHSTTASGWSKVPMAEVTNFLADREIDNDISKYEQFGYLSGLPLYVPY